MAAAVPKIKLSNGNEMPALGLGTWKSETGKVEQAVKDAIDIGYRHIDCAFAYLNEKEVGAAFKAKFDDGTVKREDIFVTSKVWNTFHSRDHVMECCKKTLENLGLEYLDLSLIHWPTGLKEDTDMFPKDDEGKLIGSDVDYLETWKGMEDCQKAGLVKSIGLSNFNSEQIQRVLDNSEIKPVVNQVECHAYLTQNNLIKFCTERNIVITCYSPLGSPDRPWAKPDEPSLLQDPEVLKIAENHGKSSAQVLIRFHIQRNTVVIPKSVTKSRIKENFNIFDFELSSSEMSAIEGFNRDWRCCGLPWATHLKYYPFHIPY